ncbi:5'-nucleotidase SurE [Kordiimonas sediminis]|uniref:5'-nucleotidase SurE n=1 Tax=Kordiimonas sediminis TaxID=1735581 RepID=A0A919AVV7_9PROT|nr:5'/3'-nucleotidase SurE [Kordiimonas sediminis]GHF26038.1 5'-nucleotidase SurE [Kordiimonas sediminis]
MAISTTRILVSNDDGISAKGIEILEKVARSLSDDVWVIAPESEQSGAGHSLTLTTALRVRKLDDKKYAVAGTPTDCVMMAINKLMKDNLPTLILSGVNRGGNLAEHVTYSGTVSVAMEGTLGGIPSIALSQCIDGVHPIHWETAETYAEEVIKRLIAQDWQHDVLMNVNFPAVAPDQVKGIRVTEQGRRQILGVQVDERMDPRGFPYYWFGLASDSGVPGLETDLKSVREGCISVTPLHLNLTHDDMRRALAAEIQGPLAE